MSQSDTPADNAAPGLAEALDWRAGRTWLVFGGFAVFLGTMSGTVIVASDVIGQLVVREDRFGIVAVVLSVAVHIGALHLLSLAIPLRDGAGDLVHGYRMLGNPPPHVLSGFWLYLAWVLAITLVAVFVVRQQPFVTLSTAVALQAAVPVIFAPYTAQFPAGVLVARSHSSPGNNEAD